MAARPSRRTNDEEAMLCNTRPSSLFGGFRRGPFPSQGVSFRGPDGGVCSGTSNVTMHDCRIEAYPVISRSGDGTASPVRLSPTHAGEQEISVAGNCHGNAGRNHEVTLGGQGSSTRAPLPLLGHLLPWIDPGRTEKGKRKETAQGMSRMRMRETGYISLIF